jgi:hypothetical protein
LDNIVHQCWKQFLYSIDPSSECAVLGFIVYGLPKGLGLFRPFSSYRVYDVQDTEFMGSRGFSKMCVQFLDEDGFGLRRLMKGQYLDFQYFEEALDVCYSLPGRLRCIEW